MKQMMLVLLCAAFLTSEAQQTVTVKGNLKSLSAGDIVYLRKLPASDAGDSVIAGKNGFTITVPLDKGSLFALQTKGKNSSSLLFYLQPGQVNIKSKSDLAAASFSGSTFIKDFDQFTGQMKNHPSIKAYEASAKAYDEAYRKKDTALRNKLLPQLRSLSMPADSVRQALSEQWIAANPASDINAYIIYMYLRRKKSNDELEQMIAKLSDAASSSVLGEMMKNSIEVAKVTAIGKTAPDFSQNDPGGNAVSLSSYRGKYVLVDFWASWCGPCRAENPKVVAAYNKFKDKNFTVLGISLDNNKNKWVEAIKKDELAWQHVSDLQYWNNEVAKQYDIQAIPANLLIDPSGVIVAKNLRGAALENKLDELIQ